MIILSEPGSAGNIFHTTHLSVVALRKSVRLQLNWSQKLREMESKTPDSPWKNQQLVSQPQRTEEMNWRPSLKKKEVCKGTRVVVLDGDGLK